LHLVRKFEMTFNNFGSILKSPLDRAETKGLHGGRIRNPADGFTNVKSSNVSAAFFVYDCNPQVFFRGDGDRTKECLQIERTDA